MLLNYVSKHIEYHRADLVSNVLAGNLLTDQRIQGLTRAFMAKGMSMMKHSARHSRRSTPS